MRSAVGLAVLVIAALVLSGCAGSEAAPKGPASKSQTTGPPAAEPTVSGDTGSIAGLVVDPELKPVAAAQVVLRELAGQEVATDAEGKFTFNQLAPGSYTLIAQKLGYEAAARKVDVRAGEVLDVTVTLEPFAVEEPHIQIVPLKGFFFLGISTPVVTARLGYVLDPANERSIFETNVTRGVETVVSTLTWQSTAPLSAKRFLVITSIVNGGSGSNQSAGRSPVIDRLDEPKTKNESRVRHVTWIAFTTVDPNDPSAAFELVVQQRFDLLMSAFYFSPAPEGYTGLPP